jgi:hypothetical protein
VTSVDKHQLSIFEETPTSSLAKITENILLVTLVNICSKSSQGVEADKKHLAANKSPLRVTIRQFAAIALLSRQRIRALKTA